MSVILVDNAYFGHALRRAPRDGGMVVRVTSHE